jgi:hypothetical protein
MFQDSYRLPGSPLRLKEMLELPLPTKWQGSGDDGSCCFLNLEALEAFPAIITT